MTMRDLCKFYEHGNSVYCKKSTLYVKHYLNAPHQTATIGEYFPQRLNRPQCRTQRQSVRQHYSRT